MFDLAFRTADGPILIHICAPVATPQADRPWAVEVRLNGRPCHLIGEDPLQALWLAAGFASSYVNGNEGLDPPVNVLPLSQAPDLLAQGLREGILAVLAVRGVPCPDEARARIAACSDQAELQRLLAHAKTVVNVDEILAVAVSSVSPAPESKGAPGGTMELTFRTDEGPVLIQLGAPVATPKADRPWAVEVCTNGRPQTMVGEDPLEALELAARFASSFLSGREGLDPPVSDLPLTEAPDVLAQGFREGLLAVLHVRGIPCPEDARARIATCADSGMLQSFLARAKTAASVEEVFAAPPAAPAL